VRTTTQHRNAWLIGAALGTGLLLSGCATIHKVHKHYQSDQSKVAKFEKKAQHQRVASSAQPALYKEKVPYFIGQAYERHHALAHVLKQHVSFKTQSALPLQSVLQHISENTGVDIEIQPAALSWLEGNRGKNSNSSNKGATKTVTLPALPGSKGKPVTVKVPSSSAILPPVAHAGHIQLNYSGSLAGLLDNVTAKTGLNWRWKNGKASVFLTETHSYPLAAMPGSQGYNSSFGNSGKLSATGGGGGGSRSSSSLSGGASQNVNFKLGKLNLFKSVTKSIKTLLATYKANGVPISVTSNDQAGVVVVTAPPAGQRAVKSYIKQINTEMTKQVYISVHIYQIELDHGENYNLNLNAAFKNAFKQYGLNLTSPSSLSPVNGSGQASFFVLKNAPGGFSKWQGSKILGSALSTLGTIDASTAGSVLAMSGQVTPFQQSTQQGYLRSSSTTTSVNVGATTSLQQGKVTTGFLGSFFPRVLPHNKILLRYTLVLSRLKSLKKITSGSSSIQVPNIASNAQAPTVLLHSGDTLVMAGLTSFNGQSSRSGTGSAHFWGLGGGVQASTARKALVIVLHVVELGNKS